MVGPLTRKRLCTDRPFGRAIQRRRQVAITVHKADLVWLDATSCLVYHAAWLSMSQKLTFVTHRPSRHTSSGPALRAWMLVWARPVAAMWDPLPGGAQLPGRG